MPDNQVRLLARRVSLFIRSAEIGGDVTVLDRKGSLMVIETKA